MGMDDPKVSSETLSDCVCALLSPEDKSNCVVNKQSCDGKHHFDSDTMGNQCLCGLLAVEGDASLVTVKEEKVLSNSSGSCKANAGTYRSSCAGKHAMDDPKVSSETLSDCVCALLSPEDKSNCVVNSSLVMVNIILTPMQRRMNVYV